MRFRNAVGASAVGRCQWRRRQKADSSRLAALGMTKPDKRVNDWRDSFDGRAEGGILTQRRGGFVYCGAELIDGPGDFFFGDYGGWG